MFQQGMGCPPQSGIVKQIRSPSSDGGKCEPGSKTIRCPGPDRDPGGCGGHIPLAADAGVGCISGGDVIALIVD
jgi:hypothetical protein